MYDLVAGRDLMKKSYYLNKKKVLEQFPTLKQENLCGGIVYFDGNFSFFYKTHRRLHKKNKKQRVFDWELKESI